MLPSDKFTGHLNGLHTSCACTSILTVNKTVGVDHSYLWQ